MYFGILSLAASNLCTNLDLQILHIPAVVPEVKELHFALASDYSTYHRAVLQKFPREFAYLPKRLTIMAFTVSDYYNYQ